MRLWCLSEKITGKPYIEFVIDRVAASRYGLNVGTINKILQTAVGGMTIGQFYEGREPATKMIGHDH